MIIREFRGLALATVALMAGCDPVEAVEDMQRDFDDAVGACHWESSGAPVADEDLAALDADECLVLRTGDGSRLTMRGDGVGCHEVEDQGATCTVLRASGSPARIWWDDYGAPDQLTAFVRHGVACTCDD